MKNRYVIDKVDWMFNQDRDVKRGNIGLNVDEIYIVDVLVAMKWAQELGCDESNSGELLDPYRHYRSRHL